MNFYSCPKCDSKEIKEVRGTRLQECCSCGHRGPLYEFSEIGGLRRDVAKYQLKSIFKVYKVEA